MDGINDIKIKEEQLELDLNDRQNANTDDEYEDSNGQSVCEALDDINNITIKEERLELDPYGHENIRIDEFQGSDEQRAQEYQAELNSAPDECTKKLTEDKDPIVSLSDANSSNTIIKVLTDDKNKSIVENHSTIKKLGKKPKVRLGEPPYECPVCPTVIKNKYTFLRHLKRHEPNSENDKEKEEGETEEDNRYKCTLCKKTYIYEVNYERHLQSHQEKEESKISERSTPDEAKSKNKSIVKTKRPLKKLKKKPKLQLGEPPYECPVCPTIMKNKYAFLRHLNRHEPESEKDKVNEEAETEEDDRYKCTQCTRTYRYEVHYERHLKSHQEKAKSKIAESYIHDVPVKKVEELDDSTRIKKLPPRIILIDRDSGNEKHRKSELTVSARKAHHRKAKSKSDSKNVDNVSGDDFVRESDESDYQMNSDEDDDVSTDGSVVKTMLPKKKLKVRVEGEPPFQCPKCPSLINNKYNYLRHLKRHVEKEKVGYKFPCTECSAGFRFRSSLIRHLRLHGYVAVERRKKKPQNQEGLPYKCSECQKTYKCEAYYKLHLKSHKEALERKMEAEAERRAENRFHCSQCPLSFKYEHIYKHHLRQHQSNTTNKKALYCRKCDLQFERTEQKMEHVINFHKEALYECKYCDIQFCDMNLLRKHIKLHKREGELINTKNPQFLASDHNEEENALKASGKTCETVSPFIQARNESCEQVPELNVATPVVADFTTLSIKEETRDFEDLAGTESSKERTVPDDEISNDHLDDIATAHRDCDLVSMRNEAKNRFECNKCPIACKTEHAFKRHLEVHKRGLKMKAAAKRKAEAERKAENQFKCSQCPLSFKYEHNYERHLRQHQFKTMKKKARYCGKCDLQFENTKQKRIHVLHFHGEAQYECRYCDIQFRDIQLLKNHIKQRNCKDEMINAENPKIRAPDQNEKETEAEASEKPCETVSPIDQAKSENCEQAPELNVATSVAVDHNALRIKEEPQEVGDPVDAESSDECAVPDNQTSNDDNDGVATEHREYDLKSMRNEAKNRFECNTCPVACKSEYAFVRHIQAHTRGFKGKTRYHCHRCPLSFSRRRLFNRHLQTHQKDPRSRCKECNITFDTVVQRRAHWVAVHRVRRHMCNICGRKFYAQAKLVIHLKTHQPRNMEKPKKKESTIVMTRCRYCLVMINSKCMEHHIRHCGPRDCRICDEKFGRYHQLTYHMKKKHPNGFFTCPQCPRMFVDELDCSKHTIICAQYLFTCDVCGLRLKSSYGLRCHRANIHNIRAPSKAGPGDDNKQIVLEDSGINIKTEMIVEETTLQPYDHQLKPVTMDDGKKREYACPICRKIFPSPYKRNNHKLVEHQVPRFKCHECGKWYHIKSALNKHIRAHNNKKQRKLISESNKKPHTCPICQQVVPTKAHFRRHIRTYHTERKFKCHICEADFLVKCRLLRHLKIHENDTGSSRKGRRRRKRVQEMEGESIDLQPKTKRTNVE